MYVEYQINTINNLSLSLWLSSCFQSALHQQYWWFLCFCPTLEYSLAFFFYSICRSTVFFPPLTMRVLNIREQRSIQYPSFRHHITHAMIEEGRSGRGNVQKHQYATKTMNGQIAKIHNLQESMKVISCLIFSPLQQTLKWRTQIYHI